MTAYRRLESAKDKTGITAMRITIFGSAPNRRLVEELDDCDPLRMNA
jgi:hypothetical protein